MPSTPALIEPLSLDEAYLDVTENRKGIASATEIAEEIRAKIRAETGLTASAGVSYNKFLAKMASNERKPDGLFVITPRIGPAFVENLPVGKFHGIGPVTSAKMERLGIRIGRDLKAQSLCISSAAFRQGGGLLLRARARHRRTPGLRRSHSQVHRRGEHLSLPISSLSKRPTRPSKPLIAKVWRYCEETTIRGRTVTLKAKYARLPAGHPQPDRPRCHSPRKQQSRIMCMSCSSRSFPSARASGCSG